MLTISPLYVTQWLKVQNDQQLQYLEIDSLVQMHAINLTSRWGSSTIKASWWAVSEFQLTFYILLSSMTLVFQFLVIRWILKW